MGTGPILILSPSVGWLLLLLIGLTGIEVVSGSSADPTCPIDVPLPPTWGLVAPLSSGSVFVEFETPPNTQAEGNQGSPITGFKIDVTSRVPSQQLLKISSLAGPLVAGSFQISFRNQETRCLAYNASAWEIEVALEELEAIDDVTVTTVSRGLNDLNYAITFDGPNLVNGDQPLATALVCSPFLPTGAEGRVDVSPLTTGIPGFVPQVVTLETVSALGEPLDGSMVLSIDFRGHLVQSTGITATIMAGSSIAITSASLVGKVNRGDRVRIGDHDFTVHATNPFTATQLPLDTYHPNGVVTALVNVEDSVLGNVAVTAASSTVQTAGDWRSKVKVNEYLSIGGHEVKVVAIDATSLTLASPWAHGSTNRITAYARKAVTVPYDVSEHALAAALSTLPGAGQVQVSRFGPSRLGSYAYTLTFLSRTASYRCPLSPCLKASLIGSTCSGCDTKVTVVQEVLLPSFAEGMYITTEIEGGIPEIQRVSLFYSVQEVVAGGSFDVEFGPPTSPTQRVTVPWKSDAQDLRTLLMRLPAIGRLEVSNVNDSQFGIRQWDVTFTSLHEDVPLLRVDGSGLPAGSTIKVRELTKGRPTPAQTVIGGLKAGVEYAVRVSSVNQNGRGPSTESMQSLGSGLQPFIFRTAEAPEAPTLESIVPVSESEVMLKYQPPIRDGGNAITKYKIEWTAGDSLSPFGSPEVQAVTLFSNQENDTAGTFRLRFGGAFTQRLPFDGSAAAITEALSLLSSNPQKVESSRRPVVASYLLAPTVTTSSLSVPALSEWQSSILTSSTVVRTGDCMFRIVTASKTGDTSLMGTRIGPACTPSLNLIVESAHNSDFSGLGYEWQVTFSHKLAGSPLLGADVENVRSVSGLSTVAHSVVRLKPPTTPPGYEYFTQTAEVEKCDSYLLGPSAHRQRIVLTSQGTVTAGEYRIAVGSAITDCIPYNAAAADVEQELRTLADFQSFAVQVEAVSTFRPIDLTGLPPHFTTTYNGLNLLTTSGALPASITADSVIRVAADPADSTTDSCDFRVTAVGSLLAPASLTVMALSPCSSFSGETRAFLLQEFPYSYDITLTGDETSTGSWPIITIPPAAFGAGTCQPFAGGSHPRAEVISLEQRQGCSPGSPSIQTIIVDGESHLSGYFTISYRGTESSPIYVDATDGAEMQRIVSSLLADHDIVVRDASYLQQGTFGHAWRITFDEKSSPDKLTVNGLRLRGKDSFVEVVDVVTIRTSAMKRDMSGTIRLHIHNEVTGPIAVEATQSKVVEELEKLSSIQSARFLGSQVQSRAHPGSKPLQLIVDTETTNSPVLVNIRHQDGRVANPLHLVAAGDAVEIGLSFSSVIESLTASSITLKHSVVAILTDSIAEIGTQVSSMQLLPGLLSTGPDARVMTATTGNEVVIQAGHRLTVGDRIQIAGADYTVTNLPSATTVQLDNSYAGPIVTGGDPATFAQRLDMYLVTADLTTVLENGDPVWLRSEGGRLVRYSVRSITASALRTNEISREKVMGWRAYRDAKGYEHSVIVQPYRGLLETFRASPDMSFRGTGATLSFKRPAGAPPFTAIIGNPAAVQALTLVSNSVVDVNTYRYRITLGSKTSGDLRWDATALDLQNALGGLGLRCAATRFGDMSERWDFGYSYRITFYSSYSQSNLPVMVPVPVTVTPGTYIQATIVRPSGSLAEFFGNFFALRPETTYNFRVRAFNRRGWSAPSNVVTIRTATKGTVPSPPRSVSLLPVPNARSLDLHFDSPAWSGGLPITIYRVQWSTSPDFNRNALDGGEEILDVVKDVQMISVDFRSGDDLKQRGGTFSVTWGGRTAYDIPWNVMPRQLEDALASILRTIARFPNPVEVSRAVYRQGYRWKITFQGIDGDLAPLKVNGDGLLGDGPSLAVTKVRAGQADILIGSFTNEVQVVYTTSESPIGGTFRLSLAGEMTGPLGVLASALEVKRALELLKFTNTVYVTREITDTSNKLCLWRITFANAMGSLAGSGRLAPLVVATSSLTGNQAAIRVSDMVYGSSPRTLMIKQLIAGRPYYCKVSAFNSEGFGEPSSVVSAVPISQPSSPAAVALSVTSATSLTVNWAPPSMDGGLPVQEYRVEWYTGTFLNEQQTITIGADASLHEVQAVRSAADRPGLQGYFTLSFKGETTDRISWNAPAVGTGSVQAALHKLSTVGTVAVQRSVSAKLISNFLVGVAQGSDSVSLESSPGTQTLGDVLQPNDLIWISDKQFEVASIGPGGLAVTVVPAYDLDTPSSPQLIYKEAYGYSWTITFLRGHVGDQPLMVAAPADNWAGVNPTLDVIGLQDGANALYGFYSLKMDTADASERTPLVPWNASSDDVRLAVSALSAVSDLNVTRNMNGQGYDWHLTFTQEFVDDLKVLSSDTQLLSGPSARVLVSRTVPGTMPSNYGTASVPRSAGSTSYTITNLTPGLSYFVKVSAVSSAGKSKPAIPNPPFAVPRTVPQPPADVLALALSNRALKVSWNYPASDGGSRVQRYLVQWDSHDDFRNARRGSQSAAVLESVFPPGQRRFLNIPVPYESVMFIRVTAVNDLGPSPPQLATPKPVRARQQLPGSPLNVKVQPTSAASLLVSWDPPSSDLPFYGGDGGSDILKYVIEVDDFPDFTNNVQRFTIEASTNNVFPVGRRDPMTGVQSSILDPTKTYYVRVSAVTSVGVGTPGYTASGVAPAIGLPSAPRMRSARPGSVLSATSILAEWDVPESDGGHSIDGFNVQWDVDGSFNSSGLVQETFVPAVKEAQTVAILADAEIPEQWITLTTAVVNERQTVRTTAVGVDEVQTIQTVGPAAVDEIQTFTTSAPDVDEIQELRISAPHRAEIQHIRTTATEVTEVQTIRLAVLAQPEVQKITVFYPSAANRGAVGGTFTLRHNTQTCAFCTSRLDSSALTIDPSLPGSLQTELNNLHGPSAVTVVETEVASGPGWELTYTITFSGNALSGDVPQLELAASSTYTTGTPTIAAVFTFATTQDGNEPSGTFTLRNPCEAYSDPTGTPPYQTSVCEPLVLCSNCVQAFDGSTLTLSMALGSISEGSLVMVNNCQLIVTNTLTPLSIPVDGAAPHVTCPHFTAEALPLYGVVIMDTAPIGITDFVGVVDWPIVSASRIQSMLGQLLNLDGITVTNRNVLRNSDGWIGLTADVTFSQSHGTLPLLQCDMSTVSSTSNGAPCTSPSCTCDVVRTRIGSLLQGDFSISIERQFGPLTFSDPLTFPWDVDSAKLASVLSSYTASTAPSEKPFGTVSVSRQAYIPSGNSKWSGGYLWAITFLDRGWDVPKMVVNGASLSCTAAACTSTIAVEDMSSPFAVDPTTGSVDGNEIRGSFSLTFRGQTRAFMLGTDTTADPETAYITSLADGNFKTALTGLGGLGPGNIVTRSAADSARGYTWTITFSDSANSGLLPLLQIDCSGLTGISVTCSALQTRKGNTLAGSFTLTFDGYTTPALNAKSTELEVQAALSALPSIAPSRVAVTRSAPSEVSGFTWSVTFTSSKWVNPTVDHSTLQPGNWVGSAASWYATWPSGYSKAWGKNVGSLWANARRLGCDSSGLTGSNTISTAISCTADVARAGVGPLRGTFQLSLDTTGHPVIGTKGSYASVMIPHNVHASSTDSGSDGSSLQEILEAMPNVGKVAVRRSAVDPATGGYTWTVTFLYDKEGVCQQRDTATNLCNAPGDVPELQVTGASTILPSVCPDPAQCINGVVLRGTFSTFKVSGDPDILKGCEACVVTCENDDCITTNTLAVSGYDATVELSRFLSGGTHISVGGGTPCNFEVAEVSSAVTNSHILVKAGHGCSTVGAGGPLRIVLQWNATPRQVQQALESSSDLSKETGLWKASGRVVNVTRTVLGKYGDMIWNVRFVSNPQMTPPGAGDVPLILAQTTDFTACPAYICISVTETKKGSRPLSGNFRVDYVSPTGPRIMAYDEAAQRMKRKLEEMATIGTVDVVRSTFPTCALPSCSGGWGDLPVLKDGTRGGYVWKVRFLSNPGSVAGKTFPPGTGRVAQIQVDAAGTLYGNIAQISTVPVLLGSVPLGGTFTIGLGENQTIPLQFNAPYTSLEQALEDLPSVGDVQVSKALAFYEPIPGVTADVSRDAEGLQVTGDYLKSLAPGDVFRLGGQSCNSGSACDLPGGNGEVLLGHVGMESSSPLVDMDGYVGYQTQISPGEELTIQGDTYGVRKTGVHVQTLTVEMDTSVVLDNSGFFRISLTHNHQTSDTGCFPPDVTASDMAAGLNSLPNIVGSITGTDIVVSRSSLQQFSPTSSGYVFSIYFEGASVQGKVRLLEVCSTSTCCPSQHSSYFSGVDVIVDEVITGGRTEVQTISLATDAGFVEDTSGYYRLSLGSAGPSSCIRWGADPNEIEDAVAALLSAPENLPGRDVMVKRQGYGKSIQEVQRLSVLATSAVTKHPSIGLFRLRWVNGGLTFDTSNCIPFGASASIVENELSAMLGSQDIHVTREGDGSPSSGYGYEYYVTFSGPVGGGTSTVLGDVHPLEFIDVGTHGCQPLSTGSPVLSIKTVREGKPSYLYKVYFTGLLHGDLPQLALTTGGCSGWTHVGGASRSAVTDTLQDGGSAHIQEIIVKMTLEVDPIVASYRLAFNGEQTACLSWDATAADIASELTQLSSIGANGVTVTRSRDYIRAVHGYVYSVSFVGEDLSGSIPDIQLGGTSCPSPLDSSSSVNIQTVRDGINPISELLLSRRYQGEQAASVPLYKFAPVFTLLSEKFEVQRLIVKDSAPITAGATYDLTGSGTVVAWNTLEEDLEKIIALARSYEPGQIVVSRRTDSTLAPNGYVYSIYYVGVNGDVPDLLPSMPSGFTDLSPVSALSLRQGVASTGLLSRQNQLLPLGLANDPTVKATQRRAGSNLKLYKPKGYLYVVKFVSNLGDVARLTANASLLRGSNASAWVTDDYVKGNLPFSAVIGSLTTGLRYFIRTAAVTALGLGQFSSPVSAIPASAPLAPMSLEVGVPKYQAEIQMLKTAASHVPEVQVVRTSADPIGAVQAVQTTAEGCGERDCIDGNIAIRWPEIQVLTVEAPGSYQLVVEIFNIPGMPSTSQTTDPIAWDASASTLEAELAQTAGLPQGDIHVIRSGDGDASSNYGYSYTIQFVGASLTGNVPELAVANPSFTIVGGLTSPNYVTVTTVNENQALGTDTSIQEVRISSPDSPISRGGYSLAFTLGGVPQSTQCINFDAPADREGSNGDGTSVQESLEALPNVDHVVVKREKNTMTAPNGFIYRIFFSGNGVRGAVPPLLVSICAPFETLVYNNYVSITDYVVDVMVLQAGGLSAVNSLTAPTIQTAVNLLSPIVKAPAVVSESAKDLQGGTTWTIAFASTDGAVPEMVCSTDSAFKLVSSTAECVVGTIIGGNEIGGDFVIESVPVTASATAMQMKDALESVSWISKVAVSRTGPDGQKGFSWTVTFLGNRGKVPLLRAVNTLTGTNTKVDVVRKVANNFVQGSFTLSYGGYTTSSIEHDAEPDAFASESSGKSVQEALQALPSIGSILVTRSGPDSEGGYEWLITFRDSRKNGGDLPLLAVNDANLKGVGAGVLVQEIVKGSLPNSHELWLTFNSSSSQGSHVFSYQTEWDTSTAFSGPNYDSATLNRTSALRKSLSVVTSSYSLAPLENAAFQWPEIVRIYTPTGGPGSFTVTFLGYPSHSIDLGVTTYSSLELFLNGVFPVQTFFGNSVTIRPESPASTLVGTDAYFDIIFSGIPSISSRVVISDPSLATMSVLQTGSTLYGKHLAAFTCVGTGGTVRFDLDGLQTIEAPYDTAIDDVSTLIVNELDLDSNAVIFVADDPSATEICAPTGPPPKIFILFNYLYGRLNPVISGAGGASVTQDTSSGGSAIDGIIWRRPTISGTFSLGYGDLTTQELNADASEEDVRFAIEQLMPGNLTVAVTRDYSKIPLAGRVSVTTGLSFVQCSGSDCDFGGAAYGVPGDLVHIGGTWYTVLPDTSSGALPKDRLYLGDLDGGPTMYLGPTASNVQVYGWAKGYEWHVTFVRSPPHMSFATLNLRPAFLLPVDAKVAIHPQNCWRCYYIPSGSMRGESLVMGTTYFIRLSATNALGTSPFSTATGTPNGIPEAPTVRLIVRGGSGVDVMISPPSYQSDVASSSINGDIQRYIIQWDTSSSFQHGNPLCEDCVTDVETDRIKVKADLTAYLNPGNKISVGTFGCPMEVTTVSATTVEVVHPHGCTLLSDQTLPVLIFRIAPGVLQGDSIKGTPPYRFSIAGLVTGQTYYVRVAARNSIPPERIVFDGYPSDNTRWSGPHQVTPQNIAPSAPRSLVLTAYSRTTIQLQFYPPLYDGGLPVSSYKVEVDVTPQFESSYRTTVTLATASLSTLYDQGPLVHLLTGLETGKAYYIRVAAISGAGTSPFTEAANALFLVGLAKPPRSLDIANGLDQPNSVAAAWSPSAGTGGAQVQSYWIEWWTLKSQAEIQTVQLVWTGITPSSSDKFRLAFGGYFSTNLPYDSSAASFRRALMNLGAASGFSAVVGNIDVVRNALPSGKGYEWTVTFLESEGLNAGSLPLIQYDISSIATAGVRMAVYPLTKGTRRGQPNEPGVAEVQLVMVSASSGLGGHFRLSFKGNWTPYLHHAVDAPELAEVLSLTCGSPISVTRHSSGSFQGYYWLITFENLVGDLPALRGDGSYLTGVDPRVQIKDGDNLVSSQGNVCLPGEGVPGDLCPGPEWVHFTGSSLGELARLTRPGEVPVGYGSLRTSDATTLSENVAHLSSGKEFYFSVSTVNSKGTGPRRYSVPASLHIPIRPPGFPVNVSLALVPMTTNQLAVDYKPPSSDGGDPISRYRVEWDVTPDFANPGYEEFSCPNNPVNAIWSITYKTDPLYTDFTLNVAIGGFLTTTLPIHFDAPAMKSEETPGNTATSRVFCVDCPTCGDPCNAGTIESFSGSLQAKLEHIPGVGKVTVRRSNVVSLPGLRWVVTFLNPESDLISLSTNFPSGNLPEVAQVTQGRRFTSCVGPQVFPSTRSLVMGLMYYVRVAAYNSAGYGPMAAAESAQKPMAVPGPPTGVTLSAVSGSALSVVFSPPLSDGGDTITDYLIQYSPDANFPSGNTSSDRVLLLLGGAPYVRLISGLTKGLRYYFRVAARNARGLGVWQTSSPAALAPTTAPSAPTNVVLGVTGPSLLTVSFRPPVDDGGAAITDYQIVWDLFPSFGSLYPLPDKGSSIVPAGEESYTIPSLTMNKKYYVGVTASNLAGGGLLQVSAPSSATPSLQVPGKPWGLSALPTANPGELLIRWQPPRIPAHGIPCSGTLSAPGNCPQVDGRDGALGGAPLLHYHIIWNEKPTFNGQGGRVQVHGESTQHTLTGVLQSGIQYYIRVAAINSAGVGPYCSRQDYLGYLCPDNLFEKGGRIVSGSYVSATAL